MSDLSAELELFRQKWIEETRREAPVESERPLVSPTQSKHLEPELIEEPLIVKKKVQINRSSMSAVELFGQAVAYESSGQMSEALYYYRKAFKMDGEVQKLYHRLQSRQLLNLESENQDIPTDDFVFKRTIQMAPDYSSKQRSIQEATQVLGDSFNQELLHPSSTEFLKASICKSFEENLTYPPLSEEAKSAGLKLEEQTPYSPWKFNQLDHTKPFYFDKFPHEVVLLLIKHLLFSAIPVTRSTEPPPELEPSHHSSGKFRKKHVLTPQERRQRYELELGLRETPNLKIDVEALERFARVCRFARLITLDSSLWKSLVNRVYTPPFMIAPFREGSSLDQLVKEWHGHDYRRCFIEQPRIRYDGVYISVVTYLRRGDSSNAAWIAPTHMVTFYRYLRFYASGLVLSLQTAEPPENIVRHFNPGMRMEGLRRGEWRLRNGQVTCFNLKDYKEKHEEGKYTFSISCKLSSSGRGKMNKLVILSLETLNMSTGEELEVPIRPAKAFFFSKVLVYGVDEE